MNISLTEQVIWRFVVSGLLSALASVSVFTYYTGITSWEDFSRASGMLGLALAIGFIQGVFMALHKYFTGATIPVSTIPQAGIVE